MADNAAATAIPSADLSAVQKSIEREVKQGDPEGAAARLEGLAPPEQADVIADLNAASRRAILGSLSPQRLAEILEHMRDRRTVSLSGAVDVDRLAATLDAAPPNVAADVLRGMSLPEATETMARMQNVAVVGDLLTYEPDEAGAIMTPEVLGLRDALTATHALHFVKSCGYRPRFMHNLFVINRENRLVGKLELSDLIIAGPTAKLSDLMDTEVVSVLTGTDKEECARIMERYQLRSVPVVDTAGVLQGVIAVEDLVKVAEEEATEDMFRIVGVEGQDRPVGPLWPSIKNRFPWLLFQLASVIAAGFVVSVFQPSISKLAILAVFIPVIAGQAGIAGVQTVTVVVRSLALQEVSGTDSKQMMTRELALALIQGVGTSIILGFVCWLWRQDIYLSVVLGASILVNLLVAGASGVVIPLGLKALRIDPATASAVVITTVTDVFGLVVYLGLATLFLNFFRGVAQV
ncbi:MAG: magnesium transporter [Chloroflexi bacterium]|nr:magnesium transporter [Chloroflexota bacterium]